MKVNDWLLAATKELDKTGIPTSRLDCLVLLEDEIGKDKSWLLAHPEYDLQIEQLKNLNTKITQRTEHIPLAYIRGKTEFYGREFIVNDRVLEPRPESETMITLLRNLADSRQQILDCIVDVGTGSGALAITAQLELPGAKVIGIDIDEKCLEVARQNAELHFGKHTKTIQFLSGDLLQPPQSTEYSLLTTTLLCNLPYVPDNFPINIAASHEPKLAIFGGPDGLDLYRHLFAQIIEYKLQPVYILTESLPSQHKQLTQIAKQAGYELQTSEDFIQVFQKADS